MSAPRRWNDDQPINSYGTAYQQCQRKIAYPSRSRAKRAGRAAWAVVHVRFSVYRCKVCGLLHLTKRETRP